MTEEELKKEAEEYALNQWEGQIPWGVIQKAYYDSAEPREKRIADLEKENAELKKEVLEVRQHLDLTEGEWGKDLYKQIHYKTQLTKAKELLKQWLQISKTSGCDNINIVTDTEQFLSEVEK